MQQIKRLAITLLLLSFTLSLSAQDKDLMRLKKQNSSKYRMELKRRRIAKSMDTVEYLLAEDKRLEDKIASMQRSIKDMKEKRVELQKKIKVTIDEKIKENKEETERLKKQKAEIRREKVARLDRKIQGKEEELKELNRLKGSFSSQKPQKKENADSSESVK